MGWPTFALVSLCGYEKPHVLDIELRRSSEMSLVFATELRRVVVTDSKFRLCGVVILSEH